MSLTLFEEGVVKPSPIADAEIARRFSAHEPAQWQLQAMKLMREECTTFAHTIVETVPHGREQALALTKLEELMFIANAGIARPTEIQPAAVTEPRDQ